MTVWRVSLGVGFDSIRFDSISWIGSVCVSTLVAVPSRRFAQAVATMVFPLFSARRSSRRTCLLALVLFYSIRRDTTRHDIAPCYPKMHGIYYLPSVSNPSCARYGIAMPLWATMHRASHRIQPVSIAIALAIETKRNDTIYKQQAATNQQQTLRCVAFYPPGCFLLVSKSNPTSYTSTMRRFDSSRVE